MNKLTQEQFSILFFLLNEKAIMNTFSEIETHHNTPEQLYYGEEISFDDLIIKYNWLLEQALFVAQQTGYFSHLFDLMTYNIRKGGRSDWLPNLIEALPIFKILPSFWEPSKLTQCIDFKSIFMKLLLVTLEDLDLEGEKQKQQPFLNQCPESLKHQIICLGDFVHNLILNWLIITPRVFTPECAYHFLPVDSNRVYPTFWINQNSCMCSPFSGLLLTDGRWTIEPVQSFQNLQNVPPAFENYYTELQQRGLIVGQEICANVTVTNSTYCMLALAQNGWGDDYRGILYTLDKDYHTASNHYPYTTIGYDVDRYYEVLKRQRNNILNRQIYGEKERKLCYWMEQTKGFV